MEALAIQTAKIGAYESKTAALKAARLLIAEGRREAYVVACFDGSWAISFTLPIGGEWYTPDGIRHG